MGAFYWKAVVDQKQTSCLATTNSAPEIQVHAVTWTSEVHRNQTMLIVTMLIVDNE